MSKYDTQLDLENVNSLSYMIKNIKPNMTVLEFGPATGYMTKYLKEEMNCKVSIIEIDEEAYEKALVFATNGFCGNIEQYEWTKKFVGKKFDVITFSDVLEHLINPEKALKTAIQFLKPSGYILISIPNIAHNAVIVDLFYNKFCYRKTGILDNTHLRFFTYQSLKALFEQCELSSINESCVKLGFEYADFGNCLDDVPKNMARQLNFRPLGYIYQFLFKIKRKAQCTQEELSCETLKYTQEIPCVLYQWEKDSFCEQSKLFSSLIIEDYKFKAFFQLPENFITKFRFDPCEFPCKIKKFQINSNVENLKVEMGGTGIKLEDGDCFFEDPFYIIESERQQHFEWIQFTGELEFLDEKDWKTCIQNLETHMQQSLELLQEELNKKNVEMPKMSEEIYKLHEALQLKQQEIASACEQIEKLNNFRQKENEVSADEIHRLNEAIEAKQKEIENASQLLQQKNVETQLLSENVSQMNEKLNDKQIQVQQTSEQLNLKSAELENIYAEIEKIHDSKFWKIYRLFHKKNI